MPPKVPEVVKPDAVLPGAEGDNPIDVAQDEGADASLSSDTENTRTDSENLSTETDAAKPDQLTLAGIATAHADTYSGFDPSKHAVNPDGTPKLKTDGSYALKRGRKAGSAAASALPPKNVAARADAGERGAGSPNEPEQLTPDMAAKQHANMLIYMTSVTLGEEVGKPTSKDEADMLRIGFKNYYEVKGVPNIPPEIGLAFAILAYVVPRVMHENSISRFTKAKLWIAAKFGK